MIYPGELSHLSSSLNRRLYDKAAAKYERKWASEAYRDPDTRAAIESFCRDSLAASGTEHVLDLGCGTGRAVRLLAETLPDTAAYEAVDFSEPMLEKFREWLDGQDQGLRDRVRIVQQDLSEWASEAQASAGLAILLEVGEFLPEFENVVRAIGKNVAPRGGLLMTRPAGAWWLFFAHRQQSRRSLERLLQSSGFDNVRFRPWRSRYELVFASKKASDESVEL